MRRSQAYISSGRSKPICYGGDVLYLTPAEYAACKRVDPDGVFQDATPEQIARSDDWDAEISRRNAEDWARMRRLFGREA